MAIQLKTLIITVLLVVGSTIWAQDNGTKFNGSFQTKQVRELWQVCSFTFQQKQPEIQLPLRWEMCDCYVDVIREIMTPEEALNLTPEQSKKLTLELIDQCNGKLNKKPQIMT
jgi:hypothetical protein